MRAFRLVLAALGLAWLVGCASASPDVGPTGAAESIPSAACPAVDLRTEAGNRLDLTGRWRAPLSGATYYFRESGSCVWFMGLSSDAGAPGGEAESGWTMSFFGNLASDFTLRGLWATLPLGTQVGAGELAYTIEVDDIEGEDVVTLVRTFPPGGFLFLDPRLVRPESSADFAVRLQDSGDCPHVVTETGEIYELVALPPDWSVTEPVGLHGPHGEAIRPSDLFGISGEVALGDGFCGPGLLIFGDRIEAE